MHQPTSKHPYFVTTISTIAFAIALLTTGCFSKRFDYACSYLDSSNMGYLSASGNPTGELAPNVLKEEQFNTEEYDRIYENRMLRARDFDDDKITKAAPSENFTFASAVAGFGLLLRNSEYKAQATYPAILEQARSAKGTDYHGYRAEMIQLVEQAELLSRDKK